MMGEVMPPPIPKVPMVGAYGRGVLHHPFIEYVYFGPSPASARDTLFQLYHNHGPIFWSFDVYDYKIVRTEEMFEPLTGLTLEACWARSTLYMFLFTVALFSTITSKSRFMKTSCSLQS